MANYTTTITNEGAALLASVIANQGTLTFNEFRFSENDYTGQESTLTEGTFLGVFITASAAASVIDSTTIKTSAQFNNSTITGNHNLYSIGIVGTDGNTTALIAVCTTTDPDVIREPLTGTSTYAFNVNLSVSDTSQINVFGTTAGVQYENLSNPITIDGNVETTVESAFGALNTYSDKIKDNLSNRNLLDNPWFTVNQREANGAVFSQPIHDRWYMNPYAALSVTISTSLAGLRVQGNANDGWYVYQKIERFKELGGKKVTLSVACSILNQPVDLIYLIDGTITIVGEASTTGINSQTFTIPDLSTATSFAIGVRGGANSDVQFVIKLELGSVSTLANDVAPDYTTELLKCQRYFLKLTANTITTLVTPCIVMDANTARGTIVLPVPMRTTPTITSYGMALLDTTYHVVSTMTIHTMMQNILNVDCVTGDTLTGGNIVYLYIGSMGYGIDLSADL